ncbi:Fe-S cluster assembly protein SufD [Halioxenophilus sp. WMMB6]|uniref:Fe-S cluster assembly protein SufD n=1 Tax=Halioxenophilus sp. WMMB6 TaxID=3073815 RepID=UPI00295EE14C|nr:Fe-S cluster assembly protein SufD [Halioxenophilus sp. WMMB6]
MTNWLTETVSRGIDASDWLAENRRQSLLKLQDRTWPTRKTEAWRYVPLGTLERLQPAVASSAGYSAEAIPDLTTLDLVFVNGELLSLPDNLPAGVTIEPLAEVSSRQQAWAESVFNAAKPDRHLFGLANDVLAKAGVVIAVAEGVQLAEPIRLLHWQNGGEAHSRHLVQLADGSSATVIEQHLGDAASFNTSFAEYLIGARAELQHYRFALQTGAAINIGGCHFNLADHSQLRSTLVGFGSDLARLDVDINHTGEHAEVLQNAIYLLAGKELFDLHTNVEHMRPNGITEQNVRGIVGDHGKAVFNGRIHIHRYAQKTLAELNNRNLLLTRTAEVNTKPELEIYADDVRCAHGATVAEMDDKALYYLQSRGVSEVDARIMLNFGFINELIEQIELEPLAAWLQAVLKDRFASLRQQVQGV